MNTCLAVFIDSAEMRDDNTAELPALHRLAGSIDNFYEYVTWVLAFLSPIVFKLKEVSLTLVILAGVAMMAYDLWESLREKDS